MISEHEVETRVQERTGLENERQAASAVHAVLEVLGERLSHLEAEALADDLPPALGASLRSERHGETFSLAEFQQRVARRLGVRVGVAVELVSGVLETLGEALRGEVIDRVRVELQDEALAALFLTPERSEAPVHLHPERRTLAEGRAGARGRSPRPGRTGCRPSPWRRPTTRTGRRSSRARAASPRSESARRSPRAGPARATRSASWITERPRRARCAAGTACFACFSSTPVSSLWPPR